MDTSVSRVANWLQITGAPSDLITIGSTVCDIIKDYRENLPLAAKQAQERVQHAQTLLDRLEPFISSTTALGTDLTVWKEKLEGASAVVQKHKGDPSWWTAAAAVNALDGVIADVDDLLDVISRTLLVDAHVHRTQNDQATVLERRLLDALEFYSRRTTIGFNVRVESAASGTRSTRYRPLALDHGDVSDTSDRNIPGGDRAAARRGGYKVDERTKFRFIINSQFPEDRRFFFIIVDRSSEDKLQVFFPNFVADTNLLRPSIERTFPDEDLDKPYFPMTLACTGHNPYESITIYLVVTTEVLQKASPPVESIKIGDVAHHVLNAGDNIIVNRFDYDIKKLTS